MEFDYEDLSDISDEDDYGLIVGISGDLWSNESGEFTRVEEVPSLIPKQEICIGLVLTLEGKIYNTFTYSSCNEEFRFKQLISEYTSVIALSIDGELFKVFLFRSSNEEGEVTYRSESTRISHERKIEKLISSYRGKIVVIDEDGQWNLVSTHQHQRSFSEFKIEGVRLPSVDEIILISHNLIFTGDRIIDLIANREIKLSNRHEIDSNIIDITRLPTDYGLSGTILLLTDQGDIYHTTSSFNDYTKFNNIPENVNQLVSFTDLHRGNIGVIDSIGNCYLINLNLELTKLEIPREVFKLPTKMKRAIK